MKELALVLWCFAALMPLPASPLLRLEGGGTCDHKTGDMVQHLLGPAQGLTLGHNYPNEVEPTLNACQETHHGMMLPQRSPTYYCTTHMYIVSFSEK